VIEWLSQHFLAKALTTRGGMGSSLKLSARRVAGALSGGCGSQQQGKWEFAGHDLALRWQLLMQMYIYSIRAKKVGSLNELVSRFLVV